MSRFVYLDHHATTPVDPRVLEAMLPWFSERPGNAASRQHRRGQQARGAVEEARRQVAGLLGGDPREVVFTSGATEALNLGLKGVAALAPEGRDHIVVSAIEHKAVLDPAQRLTEQGFRVSWLGVDGDGRVDPEALRALVDERTLLVCVMGANNEIGTVQPLAELAPICREAGALLLSDLAQAAGKIPLDLPALGLDLGALSAHKLYGPKGVGCLWVRRGRPRVRLSPQLDGGGHERGLRSGTLNVPGIVGFGAACALAGEELARDARHTSQLRDRLLDGLRAAIPDLRVNGSMTHRLPQNLHFSVPGLEAQRLLEALDDVDLSSGSACMTESLEPSYVLRALGLPEHLAYASVRVGVGRYTTADDIDFALGRITRVINRLRGDPADSPP